MRRMAWLSMDRREGLPPGQCEVCREWCITGICARCRTAFAPATPRCRSCAIELSAGVERCGDCLRDPPPFQSARCAVRYAFPWDGLIAGLKFADRVELAGPLAALLADRLSLPPPGQAADLSPSVIVPVPLSASRLAQRGYNQAWELGRRLSVLTRIPGHAGCLLRTFDTPQQAGLSRRQRQDNLRGSMRVTTDGERRIRGRQVALVDDVMTTGATAREAARALLEAGARGVDLWVVARTPAL